MKQEVLLGIDTIEVVIDTQTILNKNNITFYSSNGNEVGKLVHRQGKKKGYNLILNLPRCVRQNNIQPLPYKFLRHLIIEQNKIPYLKINAKYYINYKHFLNYMDELN